MPFIVGIGGTTRTQSSTETALSIALKAAEHAGAETRQFESEFLVGLPHYGTMETRSCGQAMDFITAVRRADGIILSSPGYHGTVSGLVKNAIDYIEETSRDPRPYLEGIPVGLIVTAFGWQATGTTLMAMRSIVHSLRGWPTPLGVTIKTQEGLFADGCCNDISVQSQLELMANHVVNFATNQWTPNVPTVAA